MEAIFLDISILRMYNKKKQGQIDMNYYEKHNNKAKSFSVKELLQSNVSAFDTVYSEILTFLETYLKSDDKISLLDYYIRIIKKNIIYDYDNWIIDPRYLSLSKEAKEYFYHPRGGWFNIPDRYYNDDGIIQYAFAGEQEIDLASTDVLCYPTKHKTVSETITYSSLNFNAKALTHKVLYIPYINFALLLSKGHHQISVYRAFNRSLSINARCLDISKLFDYVSTDGARWIYKNAPNITDDEVCDYRLPLLYSLAKLKYSIETE